MVEVGSDARALDMMRHNGLVVYRKDCDCVTKEASQLDLAPQSVKQDYPVDFLLEQYGGFVSDASNWMWNKLLFPISKLA